MLERATRLCATSPTMATWSPSRCPFRSRMVSRSRRAWVGCSWAPSPALTTEQRSVRASSSAAPADECRTTTTSGRMASMFRAVSSSVSPFPALAVEAEKLITSAASRFPATSKDVRVEGGANRAAREENVVDQHDGPALDGERDVGAADPRLVGLEAKIVTVERDVERSDRDLGAVDRGDAVGQPLGQGHPARPEPDEREVDGAAVALEDLVADPREGPLERRLVEDLGLDHTSAVRWAKKTPRAGRGWVRAVLGCRFMVPLAGLAGLA